MPKDILDRGLDQLLAGLDVEPALLEEGRQAARLLTLHEQDEKERWVAFMARILEEMWRASLAIQGANLKTTFEEVQPDHVVGPSTTTSGA